MTAEVEHDPASPPLPRDRGRWATRTQKLTLLAVCCGAGLGVLVLSNWISTGNKPDEDKSAVRISGPGLPLKVPTEARPAPTPTLPLPAGLPALQNIVAPTFALPNMSKATEAPIFASITASSSGDPAAKVAHGPATGEAHMATATAAGDKGALSSALQPSDIGAPAKATLLKHPTLTIPAGTIIPCSLQTAVNSQLPGFVTCVVPAEVRGATGTVTLLDRGTQIFGEIKSGIRQGQDRIFILWTRARTPDNVIVSLHSPAADELGAAGAPGQVDSHFWQRFGAAILFSIIEAAPQIASSALQNGSNNSYTSLYSPSQQLAGTILNDTIHIPPTLVKNIGESVTVFVARDLDFSNVFDLRARQ